MSGSSTPGTDDTTPDLTLLPVESRPWTGNREPTRYLPARIVTAPEWLSYEEQQQVNRQTWNRYVSVLAREGYGVLRALAARLEAYEARQRAQRDRFAQMVQDQRARTLEVWRMRREFGSDSPVEEAVGKPGAGGWEKRGAVVQWMLPVRGERTLRQQLPVSVSVGATWEVALAAERDEEADLDARFVSVEHEARIAAYQLATLEEVCRHYEVYGVLWRWDYDEIDTCGVELDLEIADVPFSRRFTPYYAWIREAYEEEEAKGRTKAKARSEVIERFRAAHEQTIRDRYGGRFQDLTDSTIRRVLGEIE